MKKICATEKHKIEEFREKTRTLLFLQVVKPRNFNGMAISYVMTVRQKHFFFQGIVQIGRKKSKPRNPDCPILKN